MSDSTVPSVLRELPYFAQIEEAHIVNLAQQAVHRHLTPGELIFLEGDPSAGLWILESGRVKAFKTGPDGPEYIMRFFGPGSTFNDLAALDGTTNPVSTMALSDVSAWSISAAVFAEALESDHQLAIAVLKGLAGRARYLVGQIEDLALRPVTARLARFLLKQVNDSTLTHPAVTRALIANHLATTPESISRSLRALEKAGAIRFDRHQILISQPDLLREIANID